MKNFLAIAAGLASAMIIFFLFESLSHSVNPMPENLDMKNTIAIREYVSMLPLSVFLIILCGYAIGSFAAGWLIRAISKSANKKLPLIAGGILTIAAIINLSMIPHPIWFMIVNVIIYIPLTLIGFGVSNKGLPG